MNLFRIISTIAFIISITVFSSCYSGLDELVGNSPLTPSLSATTDTDSRRGYITFSLEIIPPAETDIIKKYEIYWGDEDHNTISRICSFDKNEKILKYTFPDGTPIPEGASRFIVYSISDENKQSEPDSFEIIDYVMDPKTPAHTITPDQDSKKGFLNLTLKIIPPADIYNVKKYEVYWGRGYNSPISKICEFNKNEQVLEYTFQYGTQIPEDATYFIIYSISDDDKKSEPDSFVINDFSMDAPGLEFPVDSDRDEDQIGGVLTLSAPVKVDEIDSYKVYLGSSTTPITGPLCNIFKGTSPLKYTIPVNTDIPSGVTHFIVYSIATDGRISEPAAYDIEDIIIKEVTDTSALMIGKSSLGVPEFYISVYNEFLYFNADNGSGEGTELWSYNGANPPAVVKDLNAGILSSFPANLSVFNDRLYFKAKGSVFSSDGTELWVYDSLTDTTSTFNLNTNLYEGSDPKYFTIFDENLYFSAEGSNRVRVLWRYNGSGSPAKVTDIGSLKDPSYVTVFNNKLYFQADDGVSGIEIWSYDGSSAAQISSMPSDFNPSFLTVFNNELIFSAKGTNGTEIWGYNETGIPYEKFDLFLEGDSKPKYFTEFNNKLYFQAVKDGAGAELWCYDGNNPPYVIADIRTGASGSEPECFTVLNNKLYFSILDGLSIYRRLWVFYIK